MLIAAPAGVRGGLASGMDTKRHAPLGRRRVHLGANQARSRTYAYRGRVHADLGDIYVSDHADTRKGGRFRWLISTCLAGTVGVLAIIVVIAGSTDNQETDGGLLPSLQRAAQCASLVSAAATARVDGLRWAIPKTDRLLIPSGAMATTFIVLDAVRQRRGSRDYIMNKPYARLVARLAPISKVEAQRVPALNPFKLYANTTPLDAAEPLEDGQQNATVKIVELLGGVLPNEDAQELGNEEIADLVGRAQAGTDDAGVLRPGLTADASGPTGGD